MICVDLSVAARMPHDLMLALQKMPEVRRHRILCEPALHRSQQELFRDACAMRQAGIPDEEQCRILEIRFARYHRAIDAREIDNAVLNARGAEDVYFPRKYPAADPRARAKIVGGCTGALDRLRAESPVTSPERIRSADIIDRFFGGNILMCLGQNPKQTHTAMREHFRGLEQDLPHIVPNPMSAVRGLTKTGRYSNRCLGNVGQRVHLVLEYDTGTLDEQAALHMHFRNENVPLKMVVFSGSKSLHGWFDVSLFSADEVERICRYAALLGADQATFSPIQMVRTPNALRDGEKLQAVEFLA
jgi:hypothetical protein